MSATAVLFGQYTTRADAMFDIHSATVTGYTDINYLRTDIPHL